jgi:hypothetical protein
VLENILPNALGEQRALLSDKQRQIIDGLFGLDVFLNSNPVKEKMEEWMFLIKLLVIEVIPKLLEVVQK